MLDFNCMQRKTNFNSKIRNTRTSKHYKGIFLFWLDIIAQYARHPESTFENKKYVRR